MRTKVIGVGGLAVFVAASIFYLQSAPKEQAEPVIKVVETAPEKKTKETQSLKAAEEQRQVLQKAPDSIKPNTVEIDKEEDHKTEVPQVELVTIHDHGSRVYKIKDTQITVTPSGQIFFLPEEI